MKMKEMLQVSQLYVTSLECVHAQTWRLLSVIWFGGCLKARPCQGMPNDIHNLIVSLFCTCTHITTTLPP